MRDSEVISWFLDFGDLHGDELQKCNAYRSQRPNESVSAFSDDKSTLLMDTGLPVDTQVHLYVGGLQPELRQAVLLDKPRSLRHAKELALKQELSINPLLCWWKKPA